MSNWCKLERADSLLIEMEQETAMALLFQEDSLVGRGKFKLSASAGYVRILNMHGQTVFKLQIHRLLNNRFTFRSATGHAELAHQILKEQKWKWKNWILKQKDGNFLLHEMGGTDIMIPITRMSMAKKKFELPKEVPNYVAPFVIGCCLFCYVSGGSKF